MKTSTIYVLLILLNIVCVYLSGLNEGMPHLGITVGDCLICLGIMFILTQLEEKEGNNDK